MSYHLNGATEQYTEDDDDLDGRPTIPFMDAIPHLMPPLPAQDDLDPNDPPAWQIDPESENEVVPVPEIDSSEQLDTTTFIPGTNVAMWPLPGQDEPGTEAPLSACTVIEANDGPVGQATEQATEQVASPSSTKNHSLRPWFVGTFTVLFLEAAIVATANLYRAGYLSFVW